MGNYYEDAIALHKKFRGKIELGVKVEVNTKDDLSVAYTPGVAAPCEIIHHTPSEAYELTMKGNSVAIVTDGSAVLGLGNIGPLASLPVMEGKALLFKKYAGIDAWPICVDTQDTDAIIDVVTKIAPSFGAVNLEDIAAPRCFEVEERLQELGIPVFHDDQHGTAIVLLAGLINACKVTGLDMKDARVVISGAGAAGVAIARLLRKIGYENTDSPRVYDVILVDSKGIVCQQREDLSPLKKEVLSYTNRENRTGSLKDALVGANVFIGVSQGGILKPDDIRTMAKDPIVLAMANPYPEIMPEEAKEGGAAVVGTGRSDLDNQVNNVLAFPGIFRGALDARAKTISPKMKVAAVFALAAEVPDPTPERILPSVLDQGIGFRVGEAVKAAALLA